MFQPVGLYPSVTMLVLEAGQIRFAAQSGARRGADSHGTCGVFPGVILE